MKPKNLPEMHNFPVLREFMLFAMMTVDFKFIHEKSSLRQVYSYLLNHGIPQHYQNNSGHRTAKLSHLPVGKSQQALVSSMSISGSVCYNLFSKALAGPMVSKKKL